MDINLELYKVFYFQPVQEGMFHTIGLKKLTLGIYVPRVSHRNYIYN